MDFGIKGFLEISNNPSTPPGIPLLLCEINKRTGKSIQCPIKSIKRSYEYFKKLAPARRTIYYCMGNIIIGNNTGITQ